MHMCCQAQAHSVANGGFSGLYQAHQARGRHQFLLSTARQWTADCGLWNVQQASEARGAAGAYLSPAEGEGRRDLGAVHCEGGPGGRLRGHEHPADHPA